MMTWLIPLLLLVLVAYGLQRNRVRPLGTGPWPPVEDRDAERVEHDLRAAR
ncbi:hypothetical protein [Amycolatopsis suaedae]|uniref:hypothetical protein n=1 Tax=Amycolatopsis suaedae TaxID=2510978 RepID=UPI0013EF1626|nr:hypothetical protein [Amycolatopsis suaedae]